VEEDEPVAVADAEDVEESEEARVRVLFGETSAAAEHTPKQHRKSKATATAAAARRSKKQQQQDELAALFQKMGLENYLEIFVSQEIQIHDLALLIDEEVEALIPKIGPRRRFMNGLALYLEEHAEADRPHTANLTSSPVKVLTRQKRVGSVDEQQLEDHAQAFSLLLTRLTKAPRRVINTEIERSYNAGFEACRAEAKLQIAGVKAAARKRLKNNETMHASAHSSDEHIIDTLKLRLARAEAKTVRVEDMSREYVAGVKSQAKDDRKATVLVLKDCMEELFSQTSLTFDDNDVLDGETVKGKLQNIMRRVTKKHAQAIMKKKR
jgi:hypothetical protein